jgi:hypothetical protein
LHYWCSARESVEFVHWYLFAGDAVVQTIECKRTSADQGARGLHGRYAVDTCAHHQSGVLPSVFSNKSVSTSTHARPNQHHLINHVYVSRPLVSSSAIACRLAVSLHQHTRLGSAHRSGSDRPVCNGLPSRPIIRHPDDDASRIKEEQLSISITQNLKPVS